MRGALGSVAIATSVGFHAVDPQSGPVTAAEILVAADRALYSAKRAGRDRVSGDAS